MAKRLSKLLKIFLLASFLPGALVPSAGLAQAAAAGAVSGLFTETTPALPAPASGDTPETMYTVSSTADSGAGSLRQAILDANASPGLDTIAFTIGAPGSQQTIQPASALPTVSDPVVLDGWSQGGVGYAGPPLVVVNGSLAGASVHGLTITAGGSTVRGLVINGFASGGFAGLRLQTGDGNWIYGNYIGTDITGASAVPNGTGILIEAGSDNNLVGTDGDGVDDLAERNLVSGNGPSTNPFGINITTSGNTVAGNYIGVDASGAAALGNGSIGVRVNGNNNIIGTNGDGQGDAAEGNIISGNGSSGVVIVSNDGNRVAGNRIGTDSAGLLDLGNNGSGVNFSPCNVGGCDNNIIGTNGDGVSDDLEGNLISGNSADGIFLSFGSAASVIAGNLIGVDASGAAAIPNADDGVEVRGQGHRLGTDGDGLSDDLERNVISGNGDKGIALGNISGPADNNVVAGNYIGTDRNGTAAVGNVSTGLYVENGDGNRLGTDGDGLNDAGEANLISGNGVHGVHIFSSFFNTVAGNRIGVMADGVSPLGNTLHGVLIATNSDDNLIGGTGAGEGNVIAFNGGDGVFVDNNCGAAFCVRNRIVGNAIFENGELGIDLSPTGVNSNDPLDPDTGANTLQNYPVLSAAANFGTSLVVTGTLQSTASMTFTLDIYSSSACDPSGFGEGAQYLGAGQVTTDINGDAAFTIPVAGLAQNGDAVTATATDPVGNTSEFAGCILAVGDVPIAGLQAFNDSPTALGQATHFTATLTAGTGVSFAWDFGDGASGSGANPAHVYAAAGSFTATVTASNNLGSAIASTAVAILPEEPIAGLQAFNDSPTVLGQATHFTATLTAGTGVSFAWDFGDGASGSGAEAAHTYAAAGSYTATVTASNSLGSAAASTAVLVAVPRCAATPDDGATVYGSEDAAALRQAVGAALAGATVKIAGACTGVVTQNGTSQTVNVLRNLTLAGGYTYDDWTTPDPANTPTVLDALGLGRVVYVSFGNLGLENLTLQNGAAAGSGTGPCPGFGCGGGLYTAGSLTLSNVQFHDNTARRGGGMYVAARLAAVDAEWLDNTGTGGPGGAFEVYGSAVVTNGLVQGNSGLYGGGIYAANALVISGTHFISNMATDQVTGAGGAIYATGQLEITNALFDNNLSPNRGGAVAHYPALGSEALVVTGAQFVDNFSTSGQVHGTGGAIYATGQLEIASCQFQGNQATHSGGALYAEGNTVLQTSHFQGNSSAAWGGAVYGSQPLTVTSTTMISNTTGTYGGAIFHNFNGQNSQVPPLTVMDSVLSGNQSGVRGGGLYVSGSSNNASMIARSMLANNTAGDRGGGAWLERIVEIEETTFQGNSTAVFGGGIYTSNRLTLDRSVISENYAMHGSGVCYCTGFGSPTGSQITNAFITDNGNTSSSSALWISEGTLAIMHSTLKGGEAPGEGMRADGGSNVQITNAIIASFSTGIVRLGGTVVTADHTLFHGNQTDVQSGVTNLNPVYGDPLFADAASGDFHLSLGSPAIDAGMATGVLEDFEGDVRPIITQSDIGADEFGDSAAGDPGSTTTVGSGPVIITIPPGALSGPALILFQPVFPPSGAPLPPWQPVGPGFQLAASPIGDAPADIEPAFLLPVEVAISYTDAALGGVDESTLYLAVWDEAADVWVDAVETCTPPGTITRNPEGNEITITTCAAGEFALLGSGQAAAHRLYLPVISR